MEDNSELALNFSSSSANDSGNDPGDDPVKDPEVSDWDLRRARVGDGDDFRSSLLAFLLCSVLAEPLAGKDFLRFFEFRLITTFRLLLEECLFLEEAQLNGEHVIFNSVVSSMADEQKSGLLEVEGDEWRNAGTVSVVGEWLCPLWGIAIIKYMLNIRMNFNIITLYFFLYLQNSLLGLCNFNYPYFESNVDEHLSLIPTGLLTNTAFVIVLWN